MPIRPATRLPFAPRVLTAILLTAVAAHAAPRNSVAQSEAPQKTDAPHGAEAIDERATAGGKLALIRRHGNRLPLDAAFVDDLGHAVTLKRYFDGTKPVIITLNYFKCPMLCGKQLKAFVDGGDGPRMEGTPGGIRSLDGLPGRDYGLLTISFDATEGPELAALKKKSYVDYLDRDGAAPGWHFLTGKSEAIQALTQAVGFRFKWTGVEYAHPSVAVVCTPDGVVSGYLQGWNYDRVDLERALARARNGDTSPASEASGERKPSVARSRYLWIATAVAGLVTFLAIFFGRRVLAGR